MDFVRLLNLTFVTFTNQNTFINFFNLFLCFLLKTFILSLNGRDNLFEWINFMTFIIFRVLPHALST